VHCVFLLQCILEQQQEYDRAQTTYLRSYGRHNDGCYFERSVRQLGWSAAFVRFAFQRRTHVERLRPLFLQPRPGAGDARGEPRTISVFIDGDFAGGLDVLRSIPVADVESIRRLQPTLAYATLGSLYMADEILMVRLRCRVAC